MAIARDPETGPRWRLRHAERPAHVLLRTWHIAHSKQHHASIEVRTRGIRIEFE